MGFFSAIKNFFGQKDDASAKDTASASGQEYAYQLEQSTLENLEAVAPGAVADGEAAELEGVETAESMPEAAENAAQMDEKAQSEALREELRDIEREIDVIEDDIHIIETENAGPVEEQVSIAQEETAQDNVAPATEDSGGDDALLVRLRQADPRLSAWLGIILENVDEAGELLWSRMRFLLDALEAPPAEINAFVDDFRIWLERMEYRHVDEFRSELQYRLALALDLEDEDDERARLMVKLSQGLAKTREQFGRRLDELFSAHGELDQPFWDELEELFIMADLGYETSVEMVERLKVRARRQKITRAGAARELLREEIEEIFRHEKRITAVNRPEVVLMVGVNGVGKTTTIAKLAHRDHMRGKKVLIAAGDTFRAAAIEQLQVWAERAGVEFFARPPGSDPASVAWEAMEHAKKNNVDIVYMDTAGRLQTKVNLMEELGKIRQVLAKKHPGAPHRCVLVLDATTGQNAISQAKLFKESAGADELILTKLDGTAKGGVAIAVAMRENLPISYVGLGEKMEDLRPFNGEDYAAVLLGEKSA